MDLTPIVLEGAAVRLEPLSLTHADALVEAAADGALWESKVTTIPTSASIESYINNALLTHQQGAALPFAIVSKLNSRVVGSTRFLHITAGHRRVEIGYTWLASSAQRTAVNTEAKLLLLTHAFERWQCIRAELLTDVLNSASRAAIRRLGAREEGVLHHHMLMPDGRIRDSVIHAIVANDWPAIKARLQDRLSA